MRTRSTRSAPRPSWRRGLLGVAADRLRVAGCARVADVERLRQSDDGRELQLGPAGARRRREHARHLGAVDDRAVLPSSLAASIARGGGGQQLLAIVAVVGAARHPEGDRHRSRLVRARAVARRGAAARRPGRRRARRSPGAGARTPRPRAVPPNRCAASTSPCREPRAGAPHRPPRGHRGCSPSEARRGRRRSPTRAVPCAWQRSSSTSNNCSKARRLSRPVSGSVRIASERRAARLAICTRWRRVTASRTSTPPSASMDRSPIPRYLSGEWTSLFSR